VSELQRKVSVGRSVCRWCGEVIVWNERKKRWEDYDLLHSEICVVETEHEPEVEDDAPV